MKLLCWNCHGMKKPVAVRALLGIQGRVRPDVLFLPEAYLSKAKAEKLRRRLGFKVMAESESDGRSGGLVCFGTLNWMLLLLKYIHTIFIFG